MPRKQKWERVPQNTKKAAQALLTRRLAQLGEDGYPGDQRRTFGELVQEWWTVGQPGWKENTKIAYKGAVNRYLLPYFGTWLLTQIKAHHIERFKAQQLKRLSPTSVHYQLGLLRHILASAVRWQWLSRNPATQVTRPKVQSVERAYLTPIQVKTLLYYGGRKRVVVSGL